MEEQVKSKYFKPTPEDIRVGYEVESHEWRIDELTPELNHDRWVTVKLTPEYVRTMLKYGIKTVRVPYLTKEQIEAEGWIPHADYPDTTWAKGVFRLRLYRDREYWINKSTSAGIERIYAGDILSINDFRYISKLLKIN